MSPDTGTNGTQAPVTEEARRRDPRALVDDLPVSSGLPRGMEKRRSASSRVTAPRWGAFTSVQSQELLSHLPRARGDTRPGRDCTRLNGRLAIKGAPESAARNPSHCIVVRAPNVTSRAVPSCRVPGYESEKRRFTAWRTVTADTAFSHPTRYFAAGCFPLIRDCESVRKRIAGME